MSGASSSESRKSRSPISSRTDIGCTLLSDRLNRTRFSQVDWSRSISKVSSRIRSPFRSPDEPRRRECDITSMSFAHEKNERPDVVLRSPLPIAEQDGVNHEAGLAFAEEEVAERLGHEVLPGEAEEDADGVDQ